MYKKISFRDTITEKEINSKKWYKKFEKYWVPGEENVERAKKICKGKIENYSEF